MESKPRIQSKTYWGIALIVLSYFAPLLTDNAAFLADWFAGLLPDAIAPFVREHARAAIIALGAFLAGYGRDKATVPTQGWVKKKS